MGKTEELKAMIDLCKALLLSFLTALFAVLGYAFINYEKLSPFKIIIILCVSIVLVVVVVALVVGIIKFAKALGRGK